MNQGHGEAGKALLARAAAAAADSRAMQIEIRLRQQQIRREIQQRLWVAETLHALSRESAPALGGGTRTKV